MSHTCLHTLTHCSIWLDFTTLWSQIILHRFRPDWFNLNLLLTRSHNTGTWFCPVLFVFFVFCSYHTTWSLTFTSVSWADWWKGLGFFICVLSDNWIKCGRESLFVWCAFIFILIWGCVLFMFPVVDSRHRQSHWDWQKDPAFSPVSDIFSKHLLHDCT